MPIVMSKAELARIKRWTQSDREDEDVVRRRAYLKHINESSKEMCKDWPNSVENVNKRNEELRRARIEAAEAVNSNFYKKYVKRQQDEQKRLMYSARDTMFKNKDAPKLLLSAVIETAIQKEREVQLDFLKEQRRAAAEEKKRDDDHVFEQARAWNELQETRKKRRFEVNKQNQKEILDQIQEIADRSRNEYEEELELQKLDNMKAQQEMAQIKEFEEKFKEEEKQRIWRDMEQSKQETAKRRAEQQARDQMDDQLIEVLVNSRKRINQKRKETEKSIKEERLRVLEAISKRLQSGDAERDAKDQAKLEKAIREKEEKDEARRVAQRDKEERFRQERIKLRKQFLQDEDKRLNDEASMKNWQIMNRFKNEELYDKYKEKIRLENERKTKEFRAETLRLWHERNDREARELAETRHFYGKLTEQGFRNADNKLLTHGDALLDEARRLGRPTYPIHRAIDQYCKLYRLYPMPDLYRPVKEHFKEYQTTDRSRPDPDYREPPAPVIEVEDEFAIPPPHKTNGIQDLEKTQKAPEQVKPANYKGDKANGLQRKATPQPKTNTSPKPDKCTNEQCDCERK